MKVKLLRDLSYRGQAYKAGDELVVTDIYYNTMKTRGVFADVEEVEEKPKRRRGRKPKSEQ